MEERAGERRCVCVGLPLSSVLSPLLRRGERKKKPRARFFAGCEQFRLLQCRGGSAAKPQPSILECADLSASRFAGAGDLSLPQSGTSGASNCFPGPLNAARLWRQVAKAGKSGDKSPHSKILVSREDSDGWQCQGRKESLPPRFFVTSPLQYVQLIARREDFLPPPTTKEWGED